MINQQMTYDMIMWIPGEFRSLNFVIARLPMKMHMNTKLNPCRAEVILTHLPLDKMAAISQTTCLNTFSSMRIFEF